MKRTIDGLTYEEVKYNVYAFKRDMRIFAGKRDRARTEHMKAKWQRKYAEARGYLDNNQERLARFTKNAHALPCPALFKDENGEYHDCPACGAKAKYQP